MAIPMLSQSNFTFTLGWYQGDPVSLSFVVANANWTGTYTGGVYENGTTGAALLVPATITATYSAPKTTFVFSISDAASDAVPAGLWYWKIREVAGLTRFAGPVEVNG